MQYELKDSLNVAKTMQSIMLMKFKTYILSSVHILRLCLHIVLLLYSLISTQLSPIGTLNGPSYKKKIYLEII